MARTNLTVTAAPGSYAANPVALAMAAADVANKNQFTASDNDLLVIHNTGVASHTVTVTSVADPYGRTRDIAAFSVGAGVYAVYGPMRLTGWKQADGKIYVEADSAEVKFGVVAL